MRLQPSIGGGLLLVQASTCHAGLLGADPGRSTALGLSGDLGARNDRADTLRVGLAYLNMANAVKQVAGDAATDTLQAAHGKRVTVSLLRKVTRADVTEDNADLGVKMIKTKSVSRGIRVYATNPWTHRTAAYTLKASGKKVTHRPEVTEKVLSGMGDRVIGPRGQRIAHAAGVARVGNCGEGVATDRGVYHR